MRTYQALGAVVGLAVLQGAWLPLLLTPGCCGRPRLETSVRNDGGVLEISYRACNGAAVGVSYLGIAKAIPGTSGDVVCERFLDLNWRGPTLTTPFVWTYPDSVPGYLDGGPCLPLGPGYYSIAGGGRFSVAEDGSVRQEGPEQCP